MRSAERVVKETSPSLRPGSHHKLTATSTGVKTPNKTTPGVGLKDHLIN